MKFAKKVDVFPKPLQCDLSVNTSTNDFLVVDHVFTKCVLQFDHVQVPGRSNGVEYTIF